MSKTKYSPGPWVNGGGIIRAESGNIAIVCEAIGSKAPNQRRDRGEAEANARLIAAAPRLLVELKNILTHHGYIENGPDFVEAWKVIAEVEDKD